MIRLDDFKCEIRHDSEEVQFEFVNINPSVFSFHPLYTLTRQFLFFLLRLNGSIPSEIRLRDHIPNKLKLELKIVTESVDRRSLREVQ